MQQLVLLELICINYYFTTVMFRLVMLGLVISLFLGACSNNAGTAAKKAVKTDTTFTYNPISQSQKEYYYQQITPLYNQLLINGGFNGSILIAKNGEVVFEDYVGEINHQTKEYVTANSPFHIASVSKTFTAIAVLKLMEEGKLKLDDDVRHFFPLFPYENITVKNLLSHRSGLPNYVHLMDGRVTVVQTFKVKGRRGKMITRRKAIVKKDNTLKEGLITNADMLQFLIDRHPAIEAKPDSRFKYCNTNFALLALIAEKVTGVDFPTYLKQNIFDPLGMKNSYVFSIKDTGNYIPSYKYNFVPFTLEKLDCVYGDKNVYSTVRDLLLWDKALYSNKIISKQTLELAYTPYSNERPGTHNYGLGWRLFTYPDYTIPYHNGWWHGNNAVFTRLTKDTATVIVLGNRYNPRIYKAKQLATVFNNTTPSDTLQTEE